MGDEKLKNEISHVVTTKKTDLDLGFSEIVEIPSTISCLTHLTRLNLYYNHIVCIPPEISCLVALQQLHLYSNKISIIPAEISHLTSLQQLDLGKNVIVCISASISCLTNLQSLDLSRNRILQLEDGMSALVSLQALSLHNNKISEVPQWIGTLTALKTLKLHNNQISTLPISITALKSLSQLQFSEDNDETGLTIFGNPLPKLILEPVTLKELFNQLSPSLWSSLWTKISTQKKPTSPTSVPPTSAPPTSTSPQPSPLASSTSSHTSTTPTLTPPSTPTSSSPPASAPVSPRLPILSTPLSLTSIVFQQAGKGLLSLSAPMIHESASETDQHTEPGDSQSTLELLRQQLELERTKKEAAHNMYLECLREKDDLKLKLEGLTLQLQSTLEHVESQNIRLSQLDKEMQIQKEQYEAELKKLTNLQQNSASGNQCSEKFREIYCRAAISVWIHHYKHFRVQGILHCPSSVIAFSVAMNSMPTVLFVIKCMPSVTSDASHRLTRSIYGNECTVLSQLPIHQGILHPLAIFEDHLPSSWREYIPAEKSFLRELSEKDIMLNIVHPFGGETMEDYAQKLTPELKRQKVTGWLRQLLCAIAHLQANFVVHRDIRLSNILVNPSEQGEEQIKLTDFGIAALCSGNEGELMCIVGPDSKPWGNPITIPPEIAKAVTSLSDRGGFLRYGEADTFAAALMMWHMLEPIPTTTPQGSRFDVGKLPALTSQHCPPPTLSVLQGLLVTDLAHRTTTKAAISMLPP
ncbi:GTP-binding protein [Pelomyxa schiedti]|nr:GTP-binding protein [Pelomyxa schiedti]